MNHQVRLTIDAHILGNDSLQERFTAYVEILGHFMWRASRPCGPEKLAHATGRPVIELTRYFHELSGAGILRRASDELHAWRLAKNAAEITLEDVFRCAVEACSARRGRSGTRNMPVDQDIELLLTQALQTVDDHLYKSLRTYSLDRFVVSRSTPFPGHRREVAAPFSESVE
jgi:DNA-binding IscR family transcriptional regulator